MSFVVDRHEAFDEAQLVAILRVRGRETNSRVWLADGSFRHTLTRPATWRRRIRGGYATLEGVQWVSESQNPPA